MVSLSEQGGVITARLLSPTIGTQHAMAIAPAVTEAMEAAGRSLRWLVLDFSEVTFLNSYGLGMCIELRKLAETHGGQTALTGLNKDLSDLLKLVRVETLFSIAADEAELREFIAG